MYLLRVLIGSLGNLCLLWLAGIITLVLVLQQSFEKRSSPPPLHHLDLTLLQLLPLTRTPTHSPPPPPPPLGPYFVTVVTTDTYPNAFHLIHFKCFGWCNPQPLRQQNKDEWFARFSSTWHGYIFYLINFWFVRFWLVRSFFCTGKVISRLLLVQIMLKWSLTFFIYFLVYLFIYLFTFLGFAFILFSLT